MMRDRHIILGVTGGIAVYKSAELLRRLQQAGAKVKVVLTAGAEAFVTPLTFQALAQDEVYSTLLDAKNEAAMSHISLARWADLILIAPATANMLAKLAHGYADDLLSTLCLATQAPIAIAPAMNQQMWQHEATQANLSILHARDVKVIGPGSGEQACGEVGPGRMEEIENILRTVGSYFEQGPLSGRRVVVTAGPTQEPIDPVRYIANRSSGKMGYALARAAANAGASVTLISGPTQLDTPARVNRIDVTTAQEMFEAVKQTVNDADWFISAAAVADYRVAKPAEQKIKKDNASMDISLTKNPDILAYVSSLKDKPFCVGFAAQTHGLEKYAREKLSKCDVVIANVVGKNKGFDVDENEVTVLAEQHRQHFPPMSKKTLGKELLKHLLQLHETLALALHTQS